MGHVFHLAWYMNGVGFGDSSRTSVPKIMASYPPRVSSANRQSDNEGEMGGGSYPHTSMCRDKSPAPFQCVGVSIACGSAIFCRT